MLTGHSYSFWSEPVTACILCVCFMVVAVELSGEHPFWRRYDVHAADVLFEDRIRKTFVSVVVALLLGLIANGVVSGRFELPVVEWTDWQTIKIVSFVLFLLFVKQMLYKVVNFSFFSKEQRGEWENVYSNINCLIGYCLFVLYLVFVYLNVDSTTGIAATALCYILAKIVLFFNVFRIFLSKTHGILHLIVYFCALEIVPPVFLWYGVISIKENYLLNSWF